jgi:hypothetical protein
LSNPYNAQNNRKTALGTCHISVADSERAAPTFGAARTAGGGPALIPRPSTPRWPTPTAARNLGKALVCLKPVYEMHNMNDVNPPPGPASDNPNFQDGWIISIMFFRGRYLSGGTTNWTDVLSSFSNDPEGDSLGSVANACYVNYTWWEALKNDPYLAGWAL